MRWAGLAAVAALVVLGCGEPEEEPLFRAPAESRATLVLEPPVVAVGDMAGLDLTVVTRPGAALLPFELPASLDGFLVVEREPLVVVKEPARWLHRTRLQLRAIEVGSFAFPAGSVEVEGADGGTAVLHYDALPLEVVSVLGTHRRQNPYGIRLLPLDDLFDAEGRGSVGAFVAGALLALASVGVALLVRRRGALRAARAEPPAPGPPAWESARAELAGARALLSGDPREALDRASRALRRYAVRRFGGDASVRTTPELEGAQPPFTLTTRWSRFVALLAGLDAARFPARTDPEQASALLAEVEAFVEETVPAEQVGGADGRAR